MTRTDELTALAAALAEAWRTGTTIPLPPGSAGPRTRAEAYEVQDRMAERIGGAIAGWKVGATVKAVQIFEGHDGPVPGRIFADRLFASPAQVPARLLPGCKLECEFAMRLAGDVAPLSGPIRLEEIADKLVFHPAIELTSSHWAPGTGHRATTTFDTIADNGSAGAAVLGPAVGRWRDLPFETMVIDARLDGSLPIQAYAGVYRRHPLEIAAETFTDLRARGVRLERGMVLLTGSLTLPTAFRKGQKLVARFADLPPLDVELI